MKAALKYNRIFFSKNGLLFGVILFLWLGGVGLIVFDLKPNSHVKYEGSIGVLLGFAGVFLGVMLAKHNRAMALSSFNLTLPFFNRVVVTGNAIIFAIFFALPAFLIARHDVMSFSYGLMITATFFLCVWTGRYGENFASFVGIAFMLMAVSLIDGNWKLNQAMSLAGMSADLVLMLLLNLVFAAGYLVSHLNKREIGSEVSDYKLTRSQKFGRTFRLDILDKYTRNGFLAIYSKSMLHLGKGRLGFLLQAANGKVAYETIMYRYLFFPTALILYWFTEWAAKPAYGGIVIFLMLAATFVEAERYLVTSKQLASAWLCSNAESRLAFKQKVLLGTLQAFSLHSVIVGILVIALIPVYKVVNMENALIAFYGVVLVMSLLHICFSLLLACADKKSDNWLWVIRGATIALGGVYAIKVMTIDQPMVLASIVGFCLLALLMLCSQQWLKRDIEFA